MRALEILVVEDLKSSIGDLQILNGVSLFVGRGEVVSVLGRNGAGKTTLLRSIAGVLRKKTGKILFEGKDITHMEPYKISKLGISYIPAEKGSFGNLTVLENLKIAYMSEKKSLGEKLELVFSLFPDLKRLANLMGRQLSGGQQKMLSIACALMRDFKLLMLDELSEGLSPATTKSLYESLISLQKSEGFSMLVIEQNASVVGRISDRIYIMDKGKVVASMKGSEIEEKAEIISRFVGVSV